MADIITGSIVASQDSVDALRAEHVAVRDQIVAAVLPLMQDRLDKITQTRDNILTQLAGATGPTRVLLQAAADKASQAVSDVQTRISDLGKLQVASEQVAEQVGGLEK